MKEDFEALLDAIRERIKDDKETFHNCGHDVKGHFRAIMLFDECRERWVQERSKALGPIGETREETERRVRRETVTACGKAFDDCFAGYLSVHGCSFDGLRAKLDAIAEGKRDAEED